MTNTSHPNEFRTLSATAEEMTKARQWVAASFENIGESKRPAIPFSFSYDGKPSLELLKTWPCQRANRQLDALRTEHTLLFTDPATGLEVRCTAIAYADYPLTPYSLAHDAWMAWQFDCPEKGTGLVQAFRRDQSDETQKTFRMMGLDPHAQYETTDLDTGTSRTTTGEELLRDGLTVEITTKPGAVVIKYRRLC